MGQMVRGGRSWPSEKKFGGGAESAENLTDTSRGSASVGAELMRGVREQNAEQRLHLSAWSCPA